MSVYLYEKSLIKVIREVTGDSRIHVIGPDNALSFISRLSKDKFQLPAVILSRGSVRLQEYKNQVVALKGQTARIEDEGYVVKAQLLPVHVDWKVDVYSPDRFTCDEIVRELVFYFVTHPRFVVEVPYNLGIDQNFDVLVEDEIEDNTDLVDFDNTGECFRETITIYTENAHMFSSRRLYQTSVDVEDIKTENSLSKKENSQYGKN